MPGWAEFEQLVSETEAELGAQQPAPAEAASATGSTTPEPAPAAPEAPPEKSFLEKYIGPGSTLDSMVTGGFNSLTMNLLDEASGALSAATGGDYEKTLEQERARSASAKEAHPWAYQGGELAGAVAPALATGGASAGTSLLGAAGKAALAGATQSGVSGFGEGEGTEDRLKRAATDAAIGGATGGILGGAARAFTKGGKAAAANAARKAPNEFRTASNEAYDAIKNSDIVFEPQVMKDAVHGMKTNVSKAGFFDPVNNAKDKKIAGLITQFEQVVDPATRKGAKGMITGGQPPADSMMTLDRVERFRQTLKDEYKPGKKAFNAKLKQIETALDDAIATNPEAKALTDIARAAHRQASQAEFLDKLLGKVKDETSSTYSGTNLNNKYRQAFTKVLNDPKKSAVFDAPQLEAMKELVDQGAMANAMRSVGRLSPMNGGLMSILNIGLSHLNPALLGVGAAGEAARRVADKTTANLAEGVVNKVAGHAPGPISTQAPAAVAGPAAELSGDLGSMLMGAPASQEQAAPESYMPPAGYVSPLEQMMRERMNQGG